jgi:hypothetical protein
VATRHWGRHEVGKVGKVLRAAATWIAVMEVASGAPVSEVARRYGVSRQAVHGWLGRYEREGLTPLADHSHRAAHEARTARPGAGRLGDPIQGLSSAAE